MDLHNAVSQYMKRKDERIASLEKEVERLKQEKADVQIRGIQRKGEIQRLKQALEKARIRMANMRSICPGCQGCIECDAYDKATAEWQEAEQADVQIRGIQRKGEIQRLKQALEKDAALMRSWLVQWSGQYMPFGKAEMAEMCLRLEQALRGEEVGF